ncbi:MAG: major facilitator superfamily 1 [Rhodospirillales bacterium]|nr:major facilitator superfamily 1 [Rhodospirillales bacterium]
MAALSRNVDLTSFVDRQKFGNFHLTVILWCFLVQVADGFDITAAAFVAPTLRASWHLTGEQLGRLFSASLFAGFFGPPIFGFISDKFGRRIAITLGAFVFGGFTLAAVWAQNIDQLMWLRFCAGLGMSGALPVTVALTNEYAPRRLRGMLVMLMFTGSTIGGGVPGLFAGQLIPAYGWQSIFWIGGLAPLLIAVCLLFFLPESLKFLSLRPARRAELARNMARMEPGYQAPADATFAIVDEENKVNFSPKHLFAGKLWLLTPLLWWSFATATLIFYFINNWIPSILTAQGWPLSHAVWATTLFQFGGTLGGIAISRPFDKYGMFPVTILFVLAIPIIACIGLPGNSEAMLLGLVALAGFAVLGLNFGNIACASNLYPTAIRSYGTGWAFFFGRGGAVAGPYIGGWLIASKVSTEHIFYIATIPLAIGVVVSFIVARLYKSHYQDNKTMLDARQAAAAAAE